MMSMRERGREREGGGDRVCICVCVLGGGGRGAGEGSKEEQRLGEKVTVQFISSLSLLLVLLHCSLKCKALYASEEQVHC